MSAPSVTLDAATVDAIARRIVELLENRRHAPTSGLVDAATLAAALGVSRSTVYEHRDELGAVQLGDGDRPRLRFDVDQARAAWTRRVSNERSEASKPPTRAAIPRRRRNAATRQDDGLLPIKAINDRKAA